MVKSCRPAGVEVLTLESVLVVFTLIPKVECAHDNESHKLLVLSVVVS